MLGKSEHCTSFPSAITYKPFAIEENNTSISDPLPPQPPVKEARPRPTMQSNEIIVRNTSTPSMQRHSLRRPLRSSPLTGPALSSEGFVIPDEDGQRKAKPSRISSTPDLHSESSNLMFYSAEAFPPLPSPPFSQIAMKTKSTHRKSAPSNYSATSLVLPKSPSSPVIQTPISPPSPKNSSRPPSRESTKSLPIQMQSAAPPNFPRALRRETSPTASGSWLTTNTYGETPRFSRTSRGSAVMPLSAKEYRRKSTASLKSSPNREESDAPSDTSVSTSNTISSLAYQVRKRVSVLGLIAPSPEALENQSMESVSADSSVTSFSSTGTEFESFAAYLTSPPRVPSSAHSRASSNSDCAIIDEEVEDIVSSPTVLSAAQDVSIQDLTHKSTSSEVSSKSRLTAMTRDGSFSSLKSLAKTALGKSKSLTHSRRSSNVDSVLEPTITSHSRKHAKGLSFLSFSSSSEGSEIPPVPTLADGVSTASYSSAGSDLISAPDELQKQLLREALPLSTRDAMTSIVPPSTLGNRRALNKPTNGRARAPLPTLEINHPPTTLLPPTPSSASSLQFPITPVSPLVTPPSPSRIRFRSSGPDEISVGAPSTLDLPSAFSDTSRPMSPSLSNKFGNFFGFDEDEVLSSSRSFHGSSPKARTVSRPTVLRPTGSSKAISLLGVGKPGILMHSKSDTHLDAALGFGGRQSTESTSTGAMRKFWKTLTGSTRV